MHRCIQLALNGLGNTYPNPLVGAVIVYDNKIIGEGWHKKAGEPHAEINAINQVKDKNLIPLSTIYVSLEPCSHFGKTPPCALKIKELNFKRVVIGATDPNLKVNGKGIQIIKEAGISVTQGVLEKECLALNKRFNTFHQKKRPYIILKWTQTLDAKLDNGKNRKVPFFISNKYSLQKVHLQRSQEQSILIGTQTALTDNPTLSTRLVKGKNPLRVIIDRENKIPKNYNIYNTASPTIIFTEQISEEIEKVKYIKIDFKNKVIDQIINYLYSIEIQSVIIEGGSFTLSKFIEKNLWDEAQIYQSEIIIGGEGTQAPQIKGKIVHQENIDENKFFILKNESI